MFTPYEIYGILKDAVSYIDKKKGVKEKDFGIFIQEYFNEKKVSNSFFIEIRGDFLERYKFYESLEHFSSAIYKKSPGAIEELHKTSNGRESISIQTTIKALIGRISEDKLERIKRDLDEVKPLLILLEESIKNSPKIQDLHNIKNFISTINFSNDDDLNRRFRRLFYLFIEAYEKTQIKIPFLQLYLIDKPSSNFSTNLHTIIEKAMDNPREYSKKIRIIHIGLDSFTNPTIRKKDFKIVEKYIIKHEKNKSTAKELIRAFYSFRYFIETNYCGIFLSSV